MDHISWRGAHEEAILSRFKDDRGDRDLFCQYRTSSYTNRHTCGDEPNEDEPKGDKVNGRVPAWITGVTWTAERSKDETDGEASTWLMACAREQSSEYETDEVDSEVSTWLMAPACAGEQSSEDKTDEVDSEVSTWPACAGDQSSRRGPEGITASETTVDLLSSTGDTRRLRQKLRNKSTSSHPVFMASLDAIFGRYIPIHPDTCTLGSTVSRTKGLHRPCTMAVSLEKSTINAKEGWRTERLSKVDAVNMRGRVIRQQTRGQAQKSTKRKLKGVEDSETLIDTDRFKTLTAQKYTRGNAAVQFECRGALLERSCGELVSVPDHERVEDLVRKPVLDEIDEVERVCARDSSEMGIPRSRRAPNWVTYGKGGKDAELVGNVQRPDTRLRGRRPHLLVKGAILFSLRATRPPDGPLVDLGDVQCSQSYWWQKKRRQFVSFKPHDEENKKKFQGPSQDIRHVAAGTHGSGIGGTCADLGSQKERNREETCLRCQNHPRRDWEKKRRRFVSFKPHDEEHNKTKRRSSSLAYIGPSQDIRHVAAGTHGSGIGGTCADLGSQKERNREETCLRCQNHPRRDWEKKRRRFVSFKPHDEEHNKTKRRSSSLAYIGPSQDIQHVAAGTHGSGIGPSQDIRHVAAGTHGSGIGGTCADLGSQKERNREETCLRCQNHPRRDWEKKRRRFVSFKPHDEEHNKTKRRSSSLAYIGPSQDIRHVAAGTHGSGIGGTCADLGSQKERNREETCLRCQNHPRRDWEKKRRRSLARYPTCGSRHPWVGNRWDLRGLGVAEGTKQRGDLPAITKTICSLPLAVGRDVGGERASAVVLVPEPVNRQADSDRLLLVHSLLLPTHAPDTPWPVPSLVDLNSWPPTHPSLALALLISGNSRLTDFEPLTGIHEGRISVRFPVRRSFLFVPVQPLHRDKEPFDDDWNEFNDLGYSANKFRPSTPHPTRALGRIFVRFPVRRPCTATWTPSTTTGTTSMTSTRSFFRQPHLHRMQRISPYRPPLLLGLDEYKASESTLLLTSNLTPCHRRTQSAQRRLTGMTSYSHLLNLEDLDISKNEVDSLRQLASLPHLRELRANGNALTSTEGLEWLDGLVKLPLEGNAIEGELDPARFLWTRMEVLSARGNRLRGLVLIEDARQKGGRGQDESVERWELAEPTMAERAQSRRPAASSSPAAAVASASASGGEFESPATSVT
ncbi:hypothetical protein C8R46DRAFT_1030568 [Mycena filopes]|nr:hypothetical protein C8R46DRAFT_1030568 [Mycena filopes]